MLEAPRAVLWDFDGTLVDTEPLWCAVEHDMVVQRGGRLSRSQQASMRGQSAHLSARILAGAIGQPSLAPALYREIHERVAAHLAEHDLPYLPGVQLLLEELAAAEVPCGIVTASNRQIIDAAKAGLPKHVQVVITSDDVPEPKPDPAGYLLAMERLGVTPEESLVLEDSEPGARAALGAGAVTIAVTPIGIESDRLSVLPDGLAGITWTRLCTLWRDRRKAE